MTIGELLALYQDNHLGSKVSGPYYERLVRQVFPPILAYEVGQIPFTVLLAWWKGRPGHANKSLGLYPAAHGGAVGLGQLGRRAVKRRRRKNGHASSSNLEDMKLRHRTYFWTLYLSGSRPGEVRTMRPEQLMLDGESPRWTKPRTKTARPHVVPIPEQLVPLLRLLKQSNQGASWMFWGQHPGRVWGRTSSQKRWEGIRAKAGLSHLWLNDLRRSTASDLLNQGENIGVVQAQLNHRSLSQTAKYAYLAVRPLAKALQHRADVIVQAID